MARPLRLEFEGAVYHVTSRGNERQKIFFSAGDFSKFKEYLSESVHKFRYLLHAYVLMTNHYHLVLETPEANLSEIMHYLNGSYSTYINVKRKRSGHLLQGRFKSIVIDSDSYLLALSRYVHLNPVRAGMVERPEAHLHSSYNSYIGHASEGFVTTAAVLGMFSTEAAEARKRYKAYVDLGVTVGCESPLKDLYGGIILGNTFFIKRALDKIEHHQLEREEVSYRRSLGMPLVVADILEFMCDMHGVAPSELKEPGRNGLKKKVLYLIKKHTCAANREIGALVGMSPFAIAKAYQRYCEALKEDGNLREELRQIETEMSRVKG